MILKKLNLIQNLQEYCTCISFWTIIILLIRILTYDFGPYKLLIEFYKSPIESPAGPRSGIQQGGSQAFIYKAFKTRQNSMIAEKIKITK
jgi:hypothetical protein